MIYGIITIKAFPITNKAYKIDLKSQQYIISTITKMNTFTNKMTIEMLTKEYGGDQSKMTIMKYYDKKQKLKNIEMPVGQAICRIMTDRCGNGMNDFNGHFWVKTDDGRIVDDAMWYDKDAFKECFGITKDNPIVYEPNENIITNMVIKKMLEKYLCVAGDEWNVVCELFGKYWKPLPLCCMFNAIANQYKYGGTIHFGCNYMMADDGVVRHYIRGGENFIHYADFKKEHNHLHQLVK